MCRLNTLAPAASEMYREVCEHTNSQIADLPNTINEISSFSAIAQNFRPPTTANSSECSMFNEMMGIMSGVMDGAFSFLGDLPGTLTELMGPLEGIMGGMTGQLQGMIDGSIPDISSLMGGLDGVMNGGIEGLLGNIPGGLEGLLSTLPGGIEGVLGGLPGGIEGLLGNIPGGLEGLAGGLPAGIQGLLGNIPGGLEGLLGNMPGGLQGLLGNLPDGLEGLIGGLPGGVEGLLSGLPGGIEGLTGGLGGIEGLIGGLPNVSDIMGQVMGMAGAGFGAIEDISNQVTSEIAGLAGIGELMPQMLAILNLGSLTLNSCALAPLLNAGTETFGSAIGQLQSETFNRTNDTVPTAVDERVNMAEVSSLMNSAQRLAALSPGVPQSPITGADLRYQPWSAYLHGDNSGADAGPTPNAHSILSGAAGSIMGLIDPSVKNSAVGPNLNQTVDRSNVRVVRSDAWKKFAKTYLDAMLVIRTETKQLRQTIEKSLEFADIHSVYSGDSTAIVQDAKSYVETLTSIESELGEHIKRTKRRLSYTLSGSAYKNGGKETAAMNLYNDTIVTQTDTTLKKLLRQLTDIATSWNGIRYRSVFLY